MRLIEPTHIIWEDHKGERHPLKQINAYGRIYKFYRDGYDIILKEFIQ